jgi:hypothetical protein
MITWGAPPSTRPLGIGLRWAWALALFVLGLCVAFVFLATSGCVASSPLGPSPLQAETPVRLPAPQTIVGTVPPSPIPPLSVPTPSPPAPPSTPIPIHQTPTTPTAPIPSPSPAVTPSPQPNDRTAPLQQPLACEAQLEEAITLVALMLASGHSFPGQMTLTDGWHVEAVQTTALTVWPRGWYLVQDDPRGPHPACNPKHPY